MTGSATIIATMLLGTIFGLYTLAMLVYRSAMKTSKEHLEYQELQERIERRESPQVLASEQYTRNLPLNRHY